MKKRPISLGRLLYEEPLTQASPHQPVFAARKLGSD